MEITIENESAKLAYRLNVAFILGNSQGQVLIGERKDFVGGWQFPQGGVHKKESLEQALRREVKEEIHLAPRYYSIQECKGPYRYQFPKGFKKYRSIGQEQYYFRALLLEEKVSLKMCDTSNEFRALRWIAPSEFQLEWLPPMKQPVYVQVFQDFFNLTIS